MRKIQNVARLAGVSEATVSRVFNGNPAVRPATRERVLSAAREANYQPHALAQALRRRSSKTIGLLLPNTANPMVAQLMTVVEEQIYRKGYRMIVCNTAEDPAREQMHLEALTGHRIDGLIVSTVGVPAKAYQPFVEEGTPIVALDRKHLELETDGAFHDNVGGAYAAVSYLLGLGHKRIAAVGHGHISLVRERFTGYWNALRAWGITPDPAWSVQLAADEPNVESAVRRLLALPPERRPTALVALVYTYTIETLRAIRRVGMEMPEDLSLIVYGDSGWNEVVNPPLTTVDTDSESLGREAVNLLFRRLAEPDAPPLQVLVPQSLVVRSSCGLPRP